jgi:hypothetical protein
MCQQVVVFHGSKRTADAAELAGADVVLTTYSIIEGEHRRYVEPDKIPCRYCSRKFQPERLEVHLRCEGFSAFCLFGCSVLSKGRGAGMHKPGKSI